MAKKKKERKVPEVLIFTDINNYPDGLASMVVLAWLADKKLINIRGIISELGIYEVRRRRAMYAKGAMVHLGQPYLRAVPGGDYEIEDNEVENEYLETELTNVFESAGMAILRSGTTFLQEYIKSVKERNVYILLNAPFADLAKYIKATMDTLQKKVKKIVVMGNVLPEKDDAGNYQPDMSSFNFKYGAPAAQNVFSYVQDKGIRLVVVPTQSVKDMQMGYEFLEGLEKSKNPVAMQLLSLKNDNPLSMQYDMLSALALGDGEFKKSGGAFEKEEGTEKEVFFAKVADAEVLRAKFGEIFKDKLLPKKITLAQLTRKKEESGENPE